MKIPKVLVASALTVGLVFQGGIAFAQPADTAPENAPNSVQNHEGATPENDQEKLPQDSGPDSPTDEGTQSQNQQLQQDTDSVSEESGVAANRATEAVSSTKPSSHSSLGTDALRDLLLNMTPGLDASPSFAAPTASGYSSASNEKQYFEVLNELRIGVCLPILKNNSSMASKARSWSSVIANQGYAETQSNLSQIAPTADYVVQSVIGDYYFNLSGIEFLGEAVNDYEHALTLIDPNITDIGVGITYGGRGFTSANVTNFASYPNNLKGKFLDVRPWSKFYREINWMGTTGLSSGNRIEGCDAERVYSPKARVSREAMAAFLYRLSGSTYKGPRVSPFSDVKPGDKFYNEIAWMHHSRLSTGTKVSGKKPAYAPKSAVSREAMAAFLYRYENANYRPTSSPFADIKPGDKFYREIAWMHHIGLSTGSKNPGGKPVYGAKDPVTREAMAAFIYRLDH